MADATVLLTLTKAEADALASILYRVGGSPTTSRRKHAGAILDALRACGSRETEKDITGNIHFI